MIFIFLLALAAYGQTPVFHAAPSVKAVAENDTAKVMTIATADFDGRNGPDLATVQAGGMLNVLYNNGSGDLKSTYHNQSAVAMDPDVTFIEAADLNADNYPDLVALDAKNDAFLVFLNRTDGTFGNAVAVPAVATLDGLAVADVNRDGRPDVVALSRSGSDTSTTFSRQTFLGTGTGAFLPLEAVETTLPGAFFLAPGRSLSVVDMNRDGKADLVLQLEQGSPRPAITLAVSLGTGDGAFEPIPPDGPSVNAGPQPASSLTISDVNADGIPDALFAVFSDRVYLSLGHADGTLGDPSPVLSNMSGAVLLALDDFNKDTVPDLVVFGSGQLGVCAGKGDGTFQSPVQYTGGYGISQQPAPADFNRDGNPDLAWLDYTNGRIGLYAGKGDGTFAAASPVAGAATWAGNVQVITAADLNGDGAQDVLVYQWPHASAGGRADLYAGINDGAGRFTFRLAMLPERLQELARRYQAFSIDAGTADFNGDRRADIILRTQNGLSVLTTNADGTLNPNPVDIAFPVPVSCMPFGFLTTGDVNTDGHQDIVAGFMRNPSCGPSGSTPSGYFTILGDGAGHFAARFQPFGEGGFFVRLADLNGDRKPDLVLADLIRGGGFHLYVLGGKGDGTFNIGSPEPVLSGQFVSDILAVDYNGDGRRDLVVPTAGTAGSDGAPVNGTERVLLLPGYGDLTFGEPSGVLDGISPIWNGAAYGDFNGDRRPDLAFSTYTKAKPYSDNFGVIVLPNLGGGQFGPPVSQLVPVGVPERNTALFVADFNSDGSPDLLAGAGRSSPLFLNAAGH